MFAKLRCFVRNQHHPGRHPLGGFKCVDCGTAGADLGDMGFDGQGYVAPLRRIFSREHGQLTRTTSWDTGRYPAIVAGRGPVR
jgi:hypothetical protein